jgi:formylglycine-generating enzyme required for sulfatase activity
MSPEQARGEGHRVDGRSDIFSLGMVLYELLTGRRSFKAKSKEELLEQIASQEPRPPRQIDDHIPKELDRICLKALSKRASERYSTAKDMAEDLRHFLSSASETKTSVLTRPAKTGAGPTTPVTSPTTRIGWDSQPARIVPKGLRSFDERDADFFLELLPSPRDRDGLPDSIRFWKNRIETNDADRTFSVGLLYGPSGCGKSSLVKAGLLPKLAQWVTVVYIEATGEETEARLLKGLRRQLPVLPNDLGLIDALLVLRQGRYLEPGQKVLLVLDQFEQWLHAPRTEQDSELVQGLRQCDGVRLQCLVMVRDDFWLAVSRFMQALEIRILEGENSRLVDLFEPRHSRKVLTAFGRAFGALPETELTKDQNAFLDQAIAELAHDDKIISVRLALFAEMVKGKLWAPATLKEVGGTEGVGVSFLEETFAAATAPPQHRLHRKAAQAVLKILLPESGTDIKGHMRSHQELLDASGYGSRPKWFDDLLRILDGEIRLITPTDREGIDEALASNEQIGGKYFQLTHDYLVGSLRDWLTRKQRETRRGRAELLLADQTAVWNARPENRQLPSFLQWLQIRWHTRKRDWTPPQRKMMGKADRFHAVRGLAVTLLLAAATGAMLGARAHVEERRKAIYAAGLVQSLLNADTAQVPAIVRALNEYRQWADPLLKEENDQATLNSRLKLHASLALLPVDDSQVTYLTDRLLNGEAGEVAVVRDALAPYKNQLIGVLWPVVESPEKSKEPQRLRAAAALAKYDPESKKWVTAQEAVGNDLVAVPAVYLSSWMELLRPVKSKLIRHLSVVYRDKNRRETERSLATDLLADYAADSSQALADLLMDADDKQFAILFPKLEVHSDKALPQFADEVEKRMPSHMPPSDEKREKLAKRQANAAVALFRLGQPGKVWPLLEHRPDPRVRSYLIHMLLPLGADPKAAIKRLDEESDITKRRALLLSLGELGEEQLPADTGASLLVKLKEIYGRDNDPGLHASVEWLLRQWKKGDWLRQINEQWAKNDNEQTRRIDSIQQRVKKDRDQAPPQWYVNSQGQTMIVIPGPVEFVMGSPPTEAMREAVESQHRNRIGRSFAIAAKPVTVEEYRRFAWDYSPKAIEQWARTADSPAIGTSWFQAAAYCNWLSKREGLPESEWCYEPFRDPKTMPAMAASTLALLPGPVGVLSASSGVFPGRTDPVYEPGMKLVQNYLKRKGYRLPTEAEMEYAIRAGAVTSRYFGESDELLRDYAWYGKNALDRSWPVGSKKPNDLGFFDMHGNVWNWCQESSTGDYVVPKGGEPTQDKDDGGSVDSAMPRVLRGGSFISQAWVVRCAYRSRYVPLIRDNNVGFRPARTFLP